jgi:hypothetical protein
MLSEDFTAGDELLVVRRCLATHGMNLSLALSTEPLVGGFTTYEISNLNVEKTNHGQDEKEANDENGHKGCNEECLLN